MPELPEVETVSRSLQREIAGRTIVSVRAINWARTIATHSPEMFSEAMHNRLVDRVERRAKYVLIRLDNDETLAVHLRMTGQMLVVMPDVPDDKHTHIILTLDDGRELRFHDTRKFGRWALLNAEGLRKLEAKLGAEPLETSFERDQFAAMLQRRATKIKPLLLDQRLVAGLGNIYVDEALWLAQIHPERAANSLSDDEITRLHAAIVEVLRLGVERRGTTLVNYRDANGESGENQRYLQAYGRTGEPCPRCGTPLERIIVGQRSTHICPQCQGKTQ